VTRRIRPAASRMPRPSRFDSAVVGEHLKIGCCGLGDSGDQCVGDPAQTESTDRDGRPRWKVGATAACAESYTLVVKSFSLPDPRCGSSMTGVSLGSRRMTAMCSLSDR